MNSTHSCALPINHSNHSTHSCALPINHYSNRTCMDTAKEISRERARERRREGEGGRELVHLFVCRCNISGRFREMLTVGWSCRLVRLSQLQQPPLFASFRLTWHNGCDPASRGGQHVLYLHVLPCPRRQAARGDPPPIDRSADGVMSHVCLIAWS